MKIVFISLIIFLSSCAYYANPPKVKTRTEFSYVYKDKLFKDWENSTWRRYKRKVGYIKYDINQNETEIAEYGELWHFRRTELNPDSSVSVISGHGRYPKKLNTITYNIYDDSSKLIEESIWQFKDNKKSRLVSKTIFEYQGNDLIKEIEFDSEGVVKREKNYNLEDLTEVDNRYQMMYDPFVKVDGESRYEIKKDSLGREIEKYHYYKGEFLRRTEWDYNDSDGITTQYMYDDKPDSLWSITETRYDIFTKQPIRKHWNVLNSSVETKDIYIYNKKKLLIKILHYNVDLDGTDELQSMIKYKHKLY